MNAPNPQLLRFFAVGGVNFAFGYGVFAVLTWLGLPYPAAIGLATVAGVAFNFQSTRRLVFGGSGAANARAFVLVYAVVYGLNVLAVAVLVAVGLNVYAANAVVAIPLALLTYALQRRFVFLAP